jgi:hypothetical protein
MTKKKDIEKPKPPPKITKAQGSVLPGRSTFIDDIIQKEESQASVGPRKGSTRIPQVAVSPTAAHAEIHRKTKGTEQIFQSTDLPPLNPLEEGNSCNMEEGEGETSGVAKADPPPDPESPVKEEGIPKIPDRGSEIKSPRGSDNQPIRIKYLDQEIPEDFWHIFDQMAQQNQQRPQTSTLEYPIVDPITNAPMKEIPLQNLPTFHGLISEDPDAFLFEFDVLCRGYDYTSEPQKLKLFPSTLKGAALRWFMGLGGGTINSWDEMKHAFLTKYQDYFRTRDLKDENFQMIAKENESLEEYVERFHYNLQRSPYGALPGEVLKETLIKGMKDEWVETLNLMGKGDIYQETYDNIIQLCIRFSRGSTQTRSGMQTSLTRSNNTTSGGVMRAEVGNLLEDFKIDILSTLTTELDVLQAKQKKTEAE